MGGTREDMGHLSRLRGALQASIRANTLFIFTDFFFRFSHTFPSQEYLIQVLPQEGETQGVLITQKNLPKTSDLRASVCACSILIGRCMRGTATSDYTHFHLLLNYICMQKRQATCKIGNYNCLHQDRLKLQETILARDSKQ